MGSFGSDKWRNDRQLWWTGQDGAELRIGVSVEKDGDYRIKTRLTTARDYGIVQFYLDGEKLGEPMDLFCADNIILTDELVFGPFSLKAGEHVLNVKVVGANPDAIKRYMVGIDYVDVEEVSKK